MLSWDSDRNLGPASTPSPTTISRLRARRLWPKSKRWRKSVVIGSEIYDYPGIHIKKSEGDAVTIRSYGRRRGSPPRDFRLRQLPFLRSWLQVPSRRTFSPGYGRDNLLTEVTHSVPSAIVISALRPRPRKLTATISPVFRSQCPFVSSASPPNPSFRALKLPSWSVPSARKSIRTNMDA